MSERFSVYQFFPDDSYEQVADGMSAEMAVALAKRLSRSVGGRIGTTRRIIIVDDGDCCCFEWKFGEGVTYPPPNTPASPPPPETPR